MTLYSLCFVLSAIYHLRVGIIIYIVGFTLSIIIIPFIIIICVQYEQ